MFLGSLENYVWGLNRSHLSPASWIWTWNKRDELHELSWSVRPPTQNLNINGYCWLLKYSWHLTYTTWVHAAFLFLFILWSLFSHANCFLYLINAIHLNPHDHLTCSWRLTWRTTALRRTWPSTSSNCNMIRGWEAESLYICDKPNFPLNVRSCQSFKRDCLLLTFTQEWVQKIWVENAEILIKIC